MKKIKLLIPAVLAYCFAPQLAAQTIVVPDTLNGWERTWAANINGAQASYDNWSEGGVNTLSGAASTIFTTYYREGRFSYGFRVNLRYGQAKVEDEGVRKTDDLISIRNRFTYDLAEGSKVAAYGTIQFRTQFAEGFDYGAGPLGEDVLISKFMAPGYLTEGIGLEYNASPKLQFSAGLALKQTFVTDTTLSTNYGVDAGEKFRSEGGFETGISFQDQVMENIKFSSSLETFTNLLESFDRTDVIWSNELTGQINNFINASFQFEIRYDDDFSSEIQVKQVLSAGLTVNLY